MEITFQQYESIQDYLDGTMLPGRREDFERKLVSDAVLQENLAFEKELRQNLASIEESKLTRDDSPAGLQADHKFDDLSYIRGLIEQAGRNAQNGTNSNAASPVVTMVSSENSKDIHFHGPKADTIRRSYRTGLAVAASVIVVVVCTMFIFTPSATSIPDIAQTNDTPGVKINVPDNNKPVNADIASLFKQFFSKDKTPAEKPEYLADALNDYDRGKYSSIQKQDLLDIPGYRGSYVNSRQNVLEQGHFYKGIAFLETNNASEAIKNLHWVIDHSRDQQLVAKSQWYMALASLQQKDMAKATALLTIIAQNANATPYNKHAERLLSALKAQ